MPIRYDMPNINSKTEKTKREEENFYTLIHPQYTANDMVMSSKIEKQLREIIGYVLYADKILNEWGLGKVIKVNNGAVFNLYGPSGTGKTMMAHIIADKLGKNIMQVNYAEIESKYVGETAKNLQFLFEKVEKEDGILFFDEADALLSKRVTEMNSAADVSVNQTRSVLLKLLDDYTGICIFATNFLSNYDTAFLRRITKHVEFDFPDEVQRKKLWEHFLVEELPAEIDVDELVVKFEKVSGSDIKNGLLSAAILVASEGKEKVQTEDIISAMKDIVQAKKQDKISLILKGEEEE